jgi:hypothetical protein
MREFPRRRRFKPTVELLEDRMLLSTGVWSNHAGNPQHTALSTVPMQSMLAIRWQTPIDTSGFSEGHYGSPLSTAANTIIIPVAIPGSPFNIPSVRYKIEGRSGTDGSLKWTAFSDYLVPPNTGELEDYAAALTPANRLYFAGAGGTLYYIDHPDASGASVTGHVAFYGLGNYLVNPSAYNSTVFITTPLTPDAQGNIYFGFKVTGANPSNLVSGVARVAPDGTATWVSATGLIGDPDPNNTYQPPDQNAPTLSNDGKTVYINIRQTQSNFNGFLVALDSTTLALKAKVQLSDPRFGGFRNARVFDATSGTTMVGPDGDVFDGVFANPYNGSRGWLLHFSPDLQTEYAPGAFGWDTTASVVPASMVPSYHGSSQYLVFTKYNNYVSAEVGPSGGDGVNEIGVLDPHDTQPDTRNDGDPSLQIMKEVLTIAGPTPDPSFTNSGFPNAVREWCIDTAAVDPFTKSILVNSEDGKVYRWDMTTNTLSQVVTLTSGIGEAYTPTFIGADGTAYAINDGFLFAIGSPLVNIGDVSKPEGLSGTRRFNFTVSLSGPSSAPVTVNYTTMDGTARAADGDYVPTGDTLTFNPGDTTKTITILVNGDMDAEGDETFSVVLTSPSNAQIGKGVGTAQIIDGALPQWDGYAGNPQHTALAAAPSQALQGIRWQTKVDLQPQYTSGGDLLIHYGSPVITTADTVIVPVKTGASDGFELRAFNGTDGAPKWTQTTDYTLAAHSWTPSYSPVLTADGRLYFAGAGGTVYYTDNPDSPNPTFNQLAFYGLSNYTGNPSNFNQTVFIDSPLTTDAQGDLFFGFRVQGANVLGLASGIARIDINGTGSWVTASAAAGDGTITQDVQNCAPAISNDQQTVYVAVRNNSSTGYLLGLDATTLATKYKVFLRDPRQNFANPAVLPDISTASPLIGPDGDVYFGIFGNPYNGSRGFMAHFDATLTQTKPFGAFGWDDTASIVPASMVPSYTGSSSYLIFTKYNNYVAAEVGPSGGDGFNLVAVLDPNATQPDTRNDGDPNLQVMKEILTIAGPTPDTQFLNQFPNARREWCINTAAIDPATNSILVNSEDGHLYRWDLTNPSSFTQVVDLAPPTGEAYTPTVVGPDGTVYAINNATLFAVGLNPATQLTATGPDTVDAGTAFTITVRALDASSATAVGYLGTVHITSSDPQADLPADYTFTAADQGVHTFTVTLKTSAAQSVTFTDTDAQALNMTLSATANTNVIAAPYAELDIQSTGSATAGMPAPVTVRVLDRYGNAAVNAAGVTVHFMSTDPQATLPADYAFTTNDHGVHAFTSDVVLRTVGQQFVSIVDAVDPNRTAGTAVVVSANAATHFKVDAASPATAGSAFSITVTAVDQFGNTATGYQGNVTFSSSDAQASLPGQYTFSVNDQGVHTFTNGVTLRTAGTQTVTVSDAASAFAGTGQITVQGAAATHLILVAPRAEPVASAFNVTVLAADQFGNPDPSYQGTIHFTCSDPLATLPADYMFTAGDAGVHTFAGVVLHSTGSRTLIATDHGQPSIQGAAAVRAVPLLIAVGADAGHAPEVRIFDALTKHILFDFMAYDPKFLGGVRVAVGDVNGDGMPDIITAAGPGGGPHVRVFDISTATPTEIRGFMAYDSRFAGGVNIAVGDVNNDGFADIITGADAGGGPHVKVWSGKDNSVLQSFMAFASNFTGGVRVAAGDVEGTGADDVIVAPGKGGGPNVRIFGGTSGMLVREFMAYDASFTGGIYVAAGDTTGAGKADIITGAGAGMAPQVKIFAEDGTLLQSLMAYNAAFQGGVRVGYVPDLNGDGAGDVITGAGPGGGPHTQVLDGTTHAALDSFYAFEPNFAGGVFVGGQG